MSLPPDDENPSDLTNLFGELSKELQNSGFVDDDVRDELLHGIHESLQALLGGVFEADTPNVRLVEGGKKEDAPPSDHPKPELKVAQADDFEDDGDVGPSNFSFDSPNVSVRFLNPRGMTSMSSLVSGNIHLSHTNEEQCLYAGETLRMYRLLLFKGKVNIFCGTECVGTVSEKQSIDIEGRSIRIEALCDEVAGTYSLVERKA